MSDARGVRGWPMDRARVGLVLNLSSTGWPDIWPSSIRVRLQLTGTEVMPNPQMHPHLNHCSRPMDTCRHLLVLVTVHMQISHMRQLQTLQCTPRLSPLRPHSGPVAIALKVKSNIAILGIPRTHIQRKPISSSRTPCPPTQQECTRSTPLLDPLAVVPD